MDIMVSNAQNAFVDEVHESRYNKFNTTPYTGVSLHASPGLYEQVINQRLDSELSSVSEACQSTVPIDKAKASISTIAKVEARCCCLSESLNRTWLARLPIRSWERRTM